MPNIPPVRYGSAVNRRAIHRSRSTVAAEDASSETEVLQRRERRHKQDRRMRQIKVKFERRGQIRRGAKDTRQQLDGTVGRHINTKA